MSLRPTPRGWALLAGAVVTFQLGVWLGSIDLVRIGLLLTALVVTALLVALLRDPARGRRRLDVVRAVAPNPVHAGEETQVRVEVVASDGAGRARLAGLRLAEQAAVELSGGRPLRARVARTPDRVTVRYPVRAAQRGRWPLGPLVVTRTDVFGVVRARSTLGGESEVAVWPAVSALPAPADVLVGEPDRVALGARTPSTDDANLRDYREGDDLRRVHWRSSARRGALLVRSDERAGLRPVSVLVDLPVRSSAAEWTVSMAASMALAMLDGGHRVRLVGSAVGARPQDGLRGGATPFLHATAGTGARAGLLDLTVDLEAPRTQQEADARLLDAAHLLDTSDAAGQIVLAVLGPASHAARGALAHIGDATQGWALVRGDARGLDANEAHHTAQALRRAGWRVAAAEAGEDPVACWLRLLGAGR